VAIDAGGAWAPPARVPIAGDRIAAMPQPGDLTGLLQAWSEGDPGAIGELAPLVQRKLREIAARLLAGERSAAGWQPTDLVHETYLRLLDWRVVRWESRGQFFAATARMMRRVLVDAARERRAAKRGYGAERIPIDTIDVAAPGQDVDILALEDALAALARVDPRPSQVVELRFFGGFSVDETAEALGVSARTVKNDWNSARAWLFHELAKSRSA
jgi:RNA polymerase sigma factor (TIGR02999 family)